MKTLFLLLNIAFISSTTSTALLEVTGIWRTVRHGALVEIRDCGDGTPCGIVTWVDPKTADRAYDQLNPDPALQARPLVGTDILWGFKRKKNKGWKNGHLYNPEDGKTFRSNITLRADGRLSVQGCWGPFCRTQLWTRTEAPIQRTRSNAP